MSEKLTLSQRKRIAIIEGAIEEFRQSGFQSCSMDAVAQRAEVSKRTVYNHFESKEKLFQAIVEELFQLTRDAMAITYHPSQTLEEQLKQFAEQELELLRMPRFMDLCRITMSESIHSPDVLNFDAPLDQQESHLERWIKEAINDGRLKQTNATRAASQFMGLIKGAAFWPQLIRGVPAASESEKQQLKADAVAMFLAHYQTEPSDSPPQ